MVITFLECIMCGVLRMLILTMLLQATGMRRREDNCIRVAFQSILTSFDVYTLTIYIYIYI